MRLPTARNEINWTGVALGAIPLVVMIGGWVWFFSAQAQDIKTIERDFAAWTAAHADVHKEASSQRTGELARLDTRLKAIEDIQPQFRLTHIEAQIANTSQSITDIKSQMNEIQSDQRLFSQQLTTSERKLDQLLTIITNGIPLPENTRAQP